MIVGFKASMFSLSWTLWLFGEDSEKGAQINASGKIIAAENNRTPKTQSITPTSKRAKTAKR